MIKLKKLTVVFLTILIILSSIPIISFAADEYNNTYVSYLGLVESNGNDGVVDGNIAFNSAGGSLTSDKNGNLTIDVPGMDKSNNNKVVRTFDNVAYNFEYNTGLINVDNPVTKAKCWLRITIYGDITEIAPTPTSLSDAFIGANGTNTWDGAYNVRFYDENDEEIKDARMTDINYKSTSDYKNRYPYAWCGNNCNYNETKGELYKTGCCKQVIEGYFIADGQREDMGAYSRLFNFAFDITQMENMDPIDVKFEAWCEGNEENLGSPDKNGIQEKVPAVIDTKELDKTVYVSSAPMYDLVNAPVSDTSSGELRQKNQQYGYYDIENDKVALDPIEGDNVIDGRGVIYQHYVVLSGYSKNAVGSQLPKNFLSFDVTFREERNEDKIPADIPGYEPCFWNTRNTLRYFNGTKHSLLFSERTMLQCWRQSIISWGCVFPTDYDYDIMNKEDFVVRKKSDLKSNEYTMDIHVSNISYSNKTQNAWSNIIAQTPQIALCHFYTENIWRATPVEGVASDEYYNGVSTADNLSLYSVSGKHITTECGEEWDGNYEGAYKNNYTSKYWEHHRSGNLVKINNLRLVDTNRQTQTSQFDEHERGQAYEAGNTLYVDSSAQINVADERKLNAQSIIFKFASTSWRINGSENGGTYDGAIFSHTENNFTKNKSKFKMLYLADPLFPDGYDGQYSSTDIVATENSAFETTGVIDVSFISDAELADGIITQEEIDNNEKSETFKYRMGYYKTDEDGKITAKYGGMRRMFTSRQSDLLYYESEEALKADGYTCIGVIGEWQNMSDSKTFTQNSFKIPLKLADDLPYQSSHATVSDAYFWTDSNSNFAKWEESIDDNFKADYNKTSYSHYVKEASQPSSSLLTVGYRNATVQETDYGALKRKTSNTGTYSEDLELTPSKWVWNNNGEYNGIFGSSVLIRSCYASAIIQNTTKNSINLDKGENFVSFLVKGSFIHTSDTKKEFQTNGAIRLNKINGSHIENIEVGGVKVSYNKQSPTLITYEDNGVEKQVSCYLAEAGSCVDVVFLEVESGELPDITFDTVFDIKANLSVYQTASVYVPNEITRNAKTKTNFTTNIVTSTQSSYYVLKTTDKNSIDTDDEFTYSIKFCNNSEISLTNMIGYDIMPFNGDDRGTSFAGEYEITDISVQLADSNGKINNNIKTQYSLYTSNMSSDKAKEKMSDWNSFNDVFNNVLAENKIGVYSQDISDKPTAVGVNIATMPSKSQLIINVKIKTKGNRSKDKYMNDAMLWRQNSTTQENAVKTNRVTAVTVLNRIISGQIWDDADWDGAINSDKEKGIKGITVTLLKENEKGVYAPFTSVDDEGNGHTNMITDNEGKYQFENLPKGKYIVAFSGDFSEWDNLTIYAAKDQPTAITSKAVAVGETTDLLLEENGTTISMKDSEKFDYVMRFSDTDYSIDFTSTLSSGDTLSVDNMNGGFIVNPEIKLPGSGVMPIWVMMGIFGLTISIIGLGLLSINSYKEKRKGRI